MPVQRARSLYVARAWRARRNRRHRAFASRTASAARSKIAMVCRDMTSTHQLKHVADDELLRRLSHLVQQSRRVEAVLVAQSGKSMRAGSMSGMPRRCSRTVRRSSAFRSAKRTPGLPSLGPPDGSRAARHAGGRSPASERDLQARAHLTDANCDELLGPRDAQEQTGDRGARRGDRSQAGCAGGGPHASRLRRDGGAACCGECGDERHRPTRSGPSCRAVRFSRVEVGRVHR